MAGADSSSLGQYRSPVMRKYAADSFRAQRCSSPASVLSTRASVPHARLHSPVLEAL